MRILLATDAFPPRCGGSGWSAYELARGLRARGHEIAIVQPRPGERSGNASYDGFSIREIAAPAPNLPFVRNYFKNERLYPALGRVLSDAAREFRADVIHAQHVLTGPAAVAAGLRTGVPVVCTVRDYWPVCYWSDLIHDPAAASLCPGCTPAMMRRCIRPRAGVAWPLALPLVPYMTANLARKRAALARADAVVAVSRAIADDLRARAPELSATRLVRIPNPVDIAALRLEARSDARPLEGPYAIYAGKLAPNKGVAHLLGAVRRAPLDWPLVVVGDGPLRSALEADARANGMDVRFTGWLPRQETLRWLASASLLVFPSKGPESLSRVLIEAAALGLPIAAMKTGGTADILDDDVSGLLSSSAAELATDIARLRQDGTLRATLGQAAAAHVERQFDAPLIAERTEALYAELIRR
jgi:glycosyltransferase involved in cell wall biosynthesis